MNRREFMQAIAVASVLPMVGGLISKSTVNTQRPHVYYVHPSGVATNSGLSVDSPFQTIGQAVSKVIPGDTIYIGPGHYREILDLGNVENVMVIGNGAGAY